MRIISGRWGGARLSVRVGRATRPTQERVRAAVFSRLGDRVEGARVVDLFAGSGALGLEALSRGATWAVFVDHAKSSIDCLRRNIAALKAERSAEVIAVNVEAFLSGSRGMQRDVSIVFADPSYKKRDSSLLERIATAPALKWAETALIVLETSRHARAPAAPPGWRMWPERDYGDTRITMIEREGAADGDPE